MTFHQIIQWATSILTREMTQGLYGTVTFRFEKGRIVGMQKTETEIPTPIDGFTKD